MSGRSSRSILMQTNSRFINPAISGFSKDSRSITWHQWQVEYPMERKIGLSSWRALANASSPHGYQSTGLCACCSRYGLVSRARRFSPTGLSLTGDSARERQVADRRRQRVGARAYVHAGTGLLLTLDERQCDRASESQRERGARHLADDGAAGDDLGPARRHDVTLQQQTPQVA